jgi:hypothetical protein
MCGIIAPATFGRAHMALRVPEPGDEIDGRVIDEVGEPRAIKDRHSIVVVRMSDRKYEIVSITEFRAGEQKMRYWETDNELIRRALDTALDFPVAASGSVGELRVWGKTVFGNFSAVIFYDAKKTSGVQDSFTYT